MDFGIVWAVFIVTSALCALTGGRGREATAAFLDGAVKGVEITIAMAGPICLWSGLGALMRKLGFLKPVSRLLRPLLGRIYPSSRKDEELAQDLSANLSANLLGLGNAATPMGIQAVRRLQDPRHPGIATDEMCRLVVMNTASVQLLPTTVAAVRAGAGTCSPFDILPCVWVSSLCSVSAGLIMAFLLGRICRRG